MSRRELSTFHEMLNLSAAFGCLLVLGWMWFGAINPAGITERTLMIWPGLTIVWPEAMVRFWGLVWYALFAGMVLLDFYRSPFGRVPEYSQQGDDEAVGVLIFVYLGSLVVVGLLAWLGIKIGFWPVLLVCGWGAIMMADIPGQDSWFSMLEIFLWNASVAGIWFGFMAGLFNGLVTMLVAAPLVLRANSQYRLRKSQLSAS